MIVVVEAMVCIVLPKFGSVRSDPFLSEPEPSDVTAWPESRRPAQAEPCEAKL